MRVCARVCISECISSLFNFLHHRNCTRGRSIEFYLRINRSSSYVTIGSRKTEKLFSIYSFVHLNELVYTKKQFYPDFKATKGGREWREGDFYGNVILRTSHRIWGGKKARKREKESLLTRFAVRRTNPFPKIPYLPPPFPQIILSRNIQRSITSTQRAPTERGGGGRRGGKKPSKLYWRERYISSNYYSRDFGRRGSMDRGGLTEDDFPRLPLARRRRRRRRRGRRRAL